jgi:hypothetical protein
MKTVFLAVSLLLVGTFTEGLMPPAAGWSEAPLEQTALLTQNSAIKKNFFPYGQQQPVAGLQ